MSATSTSTTNNKKKQQLSLSNYVLNIHKPLKNKQTEHYTTLNLYVYTKPAPCTTITHKTRTKSAENQCNDPNLRPFVTAVRKSFVRYNNTDNADAFIMRPYPRTYAYRGIKGVINDASHGNGARPLAARTRFDAFSMNLEWGFSCSAKSQMFYAFYGCFHSRELTDRIHEVPKLTDGWFPREFYVNLLVVRLMFVNLCLCDSKWIVLFLVYKSRLFSWIIKNFIKKWTKKIESNNTSKARRLGKNNVFFASCALLRCF